MSRSSIEWLARPGTIPEVWNPVTGCNKVSQGCKNCYAERMHKRLQRMAPDKYNHAFLDGAHEHKEMLDIPFKWKKPRTVFVNSMSDLFHKNISFDFIDLVFTRIAVCRQHTFIVLTKRPERMLQYFNSKNLHWKNEGMQVLSERLRYYSYQWDSFFSSPENWTWPLPNLWLFTSCENQAAAIERVPLLLQAPAAIRGISYEPALGPLTLEGWIEGIDAVFCGGESGPGARPIHPDWARSMRNQCKAAGKAFFFKQWGEWIRCDAGESTIVFPGEDPVYVKKVGKKKAGRQLDGKEWNEWPGANGF